LPAMGEKDTINVHSHSETRGVKFILIFYHI
jgi:hypothetical protein